MSERPRFFCCEHGIIASAVGMAKHLRNAHASSVREWVAAGFEPRYAADPDHAIGIIDSTNLTWKGVNCGTVVYVKEVRCPRCQRWGAYTQAKNMVCISCGNRFARTQGAFMDGVFLDRYPIPRDRCKKYVREGCRELELPEEVVQLALDLFEKYSKRSSGWISSPRGTAAGLIYVSGVLRDYRRTQNDVAKVMNVGPPTLRKHYHKIIGVFKLKELNVLVSPLPERAIETALKN
jgi:hypothetical protein